MQRTRGFMRLFQPGSFHDLPIRNGDLIAMRSRYW